MALKTIADLQKSLRIIVTTVELHAEEAAAKLDELFASLLAEGEEPPDWQLVQRLKVRLLQQLWYALDESDNALERAHGKLKRLRRQLAKAAQVVYDRLLALKRLLTGLRPGEDPWLKGALPRDYDHHQLDHGAKLALMHLGNMERPSSDVGTGLDPESWIRALTSEQQALEGAIVKEKRGCRELQGREAERRRRLQEYGQGFIHVAGELEALYKLVGMDEAAQTVQPSKKYPGRTHAEVRRLGKAGSKKRRS